MEKCSIFTFYYQLQNNDGCVLDNWKQKKSRYFLACCTLWYPQIDNPVGISRTTANSTRSFLAADIPLSRSCQRRRKHDKTIFLISTRHPRLNYFQLAATFSNFRKYCSQQVVCPAQEKGIVYNDEKKSSKCYRNCYSTEQRLEKNWYFL